MVTDGSLKPIEIGFGDEFVDSTKLKNRRVILKVGTGRLFESSCVIEEDGKEALAFAGSGDRSRIGDLTGDRWTLDRIIRAKMNFNNDQESVGRYYDLLRTESEKPRRILK